MKALFTSFLLTWVVYSGGYAQQPEQNPNYRESFEKYLVVKDSLNRLQGTTAQQTYKAHDFMEEKRERRERRRRLREEYYYGGIYNNWYTPYSWGHRYYSPWYYGYAPYRRGSIGLGLMW